MSKEYQEVTEKSIRFQGRKYTKKPNGYYYNCSTRKHLHQAIWIAHNGQIPENCEIHHIDFDKENNDISNLQCLSKYEHRRLHRELMPDEERERRRTNFNEHARPAAIAWHKSDEGREWHRNHAKQMSKKGKSALTRRTTLICTNCGKEYEGVHNKTSNTFCSNKCKSAYRRKQGLDNITVTCPVCGKTFIVNKYKAKGILDGKLPCSSICRSIFESRVRALF